MTRQWYVLRSMANKELALWREIGARGYECFYPHPRLCPVNPRSRRIRPYFPGYLFLRLDMEQVGTSIFKWMPSLAGFVTFDTTPAAVPENLVHAIRRHVEHMNAAGGEQLARLKTGDSVLIQGGPFDARLPGRDRVRVLLKLLQIRQMSVELPAAQIGRKKPR